VVENRGYQPETYVLLGVHLPSEGVHLMLALEGENNFRYFFQASVHILLKINFKIHHMFIAKYIHD